MLWLQLALGMRVSLCDGVPVSYSSSDSTGSNPQTTCTTQSPHSLEEFSQLEDFYHPSPALQLAETIPPPPQHTSHFPPAITTATQTYPFPQIHSASSSSQGMWPTPPSTACEDFEDYSYQGSPSAASCDIPANSYSGGSSTTSPRSWTSPDAQQLTFQQSMWKPQDLASPFVMHIGINTPMEDRFQQQMVSSPYANSNFVGSNSNNVDSDSLRAGEAPGMTPDQADFAMSDRSSSPVPKAELSGNFSFEDDEIATHAGLEEVGSDDEETSKSPEPYAKLIYQAFMSRERHTMTLQEIYQWFRDNTDKAKVENKGWQNSIRHNLSMNAVSHSTLAAFY